MGDARYAQHYEKVRGAIDRIAAIERMTDDELAQALGAASRDSDPYLANVLTTAVQNRTRRGRAVIETIADGVCVVDRDGAISFANPAASQILGWSAKELQGTQFHAIVHHHLGRYHEQATSCPLERALGSQSGPVRLEDSFAPRDGLPVPVACTISSIVVDGVTDSTVVLFADISERKRSQELLIEQARVLESAVEKTLSELAQREHAERRVEGVLAALPDAVVMTSSGGVILLANETAVKMFGYEGRELIGQQASILLPPSLRAMGGEGGTAVLAPEAAAATAGPGLASIRAVGRRKDGTEFPIEIRTSIFEEQTGPSVLTSIRDISARAAEEEALRVAQAARVKALDESEARVKAANEALEREVAARTGQLTRSYQELEAFSYSISHDLQAPLRNIEFLLSDVVEDHGAQQPALAKDIERVTSEVGRLRALVVALLQLAKVGVQTVERSSVSVSDLAAQIGADLERADPGRKVELTIHPDMSTEADPTLLRALLENLLSNAWKYTRGRDPAHVEVGALPTKPETFFVRDDGDGFDMQQAGRLFHPFSRLSSAKPKEGTGVGLASARRIVEGHGGRIWAEAVPGKGATFYFTLAAGDRP